jgi:hypothetical protein
MVTWVSMRRRICAGIVHARFARATAPKDALSMCRTRRLMKSAGSVITRSSCAGTTVIALVFTHTITLDTSVPAAVAQPSERAASSSAQDLGHHKWLAKCPRKIYRPSALDITNGNFYSPFLLKKLIFRSRARVAELADALDLGSSGQPWGFESPLSHHEFQRMTRQFLLLKGGG